MVSQSRTSVRRIVPDDRSEDALTSGIVREQAVATDGMWAGVARTAPGGISSWHHHGAYESTIYIVSGIQRMEFGPGGADAIEARPGDFLYVAPGAIHREINVGEDEAQSVVFRAGSGPVVIDVDAPEEFEPPGSGS